MNSENYVSDIRSLCQEAEIQPKNNAFLTDTTFQQKEIKNITFFVDL